MLPSNPTAVKRPRPFRIALILLAPCILLIVCFIARHILLSAKTRQKLSQIHAAKEPVTSKELDSYYKNLPLNENAATNYAQAFDSVRSSGSYNFLEKMAVLPPGTNSLPENLRAQMEKAVTDGKTALEALRKAADSGACRYPINYDAVWNALLPHLAALRICGHLEQCNGVMNEQRGDTDAAIQSVELISKYAASLNAEPDLISVLVQEGLESQASDLSLWVLNHQKLSLKQLATLQKVFNTCGPTNWIDRAVIGDRCSTLAMFDYSAADFAALIDQNHSDRSEQFAIWFARLIGQMKKDELTYLARVDEIRKTALLPFPERLDRADTLVSEIRQEAQSQMLFATGALLPGLIKSIGRDAQHTARMSLIQTALVIEQYRIQHGAPPRNLDELKPNELTAIPVDPFDGKQLRYLPSEQGYLLYSIGPDRVDDEGQQSLLLNSKAPNPQGDIILSIQR